jgi:HD-GYP domain-containing protein (c-di-GMP phosphodiesterase class II)
VTLAGLAWFGLRAVVAAFVGLERSDLAGKYLWLLALEDWAVVLSMFAGGALFGLAWSVMGLWAVAVAILPYAFAHTAFERYSSTRVTYGQTIKALAQIPEVAGLAPLGHSTRTSDIAVAIAQEMGLKPSAVIELEYAALMHDVGRITLNEPAILRAGFTDEDIARWGAQIIAEAPYLQHVSELVRLQHRPYRSPGIESDPDIPMMSKIIKVSSAYDQAQIEQGLSPVESLERIHQGSAYEFDPRVAASLRRVLVHRGVIAH